MTEIWVRVGFAYAYENFKSAKHSGLSLGDSPENAFLSIIRLEKAERPFIDKDDIDFLNAWPVRGMSWFEAEFLAQLCRKRMSRAEKMWARRLVQDPKKWTVRYSRSGAHKAIRKYKGHVAGNYPGAGFDADSDLHWNVLGPLLPLMVNVNLDDETLKLAFSVWLAGVRDGSGNQKAPISDKHFAKWRKFKVLQAFDLTTWGKITNTRYTDVFIAHSIWSDDEVGDGDFVDKTERYRKVTKPLVARLFTVWEAQRLENQVKISQFLEHTFPQLKAKSGTSGH